MHPLRTGQLLLFPALIGVILGICACRSGPPPIVYYTLDPLPLTDAAIQPPKEAVSMRIGVGPVRLPTYLERAQIVTRAGDHTLAINDFHRWAGPLDEEILRVLVTSMRAALPGTEVLSYPWGRPRAPTHQVRLTVHRFDGQTSGQVHLRGSWQLECRTASEKNQDRAFEITEPIEGSSMAALVAAQNRALGLLAGEIVTAFCE
jgi:uncharacterized lipoprotein YmbA